MLNNSIALWREAEKIYNSNDDVRKDGYSHEEMIAEIFAGLLVRECIAMCESVRNGTDVDMTTHFRDGISSGANRVKFLIAKRFDIDPRAKVTNPYKNADEGVYGPEYQGQ